jgi:hypothetical protein
MRTLLVGSGPVGTLNPPVPPRAEGHERARRRPATSCDLNQDRQRGGRVECDAQVGNTKVPPRPLSEP